MASSVILEIISTSTRNPSDISGATPDVVRCWTNSPLGYKGTEPNPHPDILGEVNDGLEILYLAMVALQVILALGNRPKGERLMYTASFVIFGALAIYLLLNTVYLTVMAFCPLTALVREGNAKGESTFHILLAGQSGFLTIMAGLVVSCRIRFSISRLDTFIFLGNVWCLHPLVNPVPRSMAPSPVNASVSCHLYFVHQHSQRIRVL
jgi:hypothetical protein